MFRPRRSLTLVVWSKAELGTLDGPWTPEKKIGHMIVEEKQVIAEDSAAVTEAKQGTTVVYVDHIYFLKTR